MDYKDLIPESDKIQESEEKRYVVTLEMYMYDKDDKSVVKQAEKLTNELDRKFDNQCSLQEIIEQKFGTVGNRKVKF